MSERAGAGLDSPVQKYLDHLHEKYEGLYDGEVASYIPELAKVDPDLFGLSVATVDGQVYESGDSRVPFTIQSISKPFTYGIAIQDQGTDAVFRRIGVEPSGDAFNSISLDPETGRPLNPMINAGAIAAASLVRGDSNEDKAGRLLETYSLYAGRALEVDEAVYTSEKITGHRNRAIGHLLRNFDVLGEDPEPTLDLYFRQCSIAIDCRDLSIMAATLANGGVNPATSETAIRADVVKDVLSVMTTCGMYDFAGEWLFSVGLPAKSGVGGGILAVLPGRLGIGVFSPRLDERGNSVRGIAVCQDLSRDLDLHYLRIPQSTGATVRSRLDLARLRSTRERPADERAVLDAQGHEARIYELQGEVGFAEFEVVARSVVEDSPSMSLVVLDLRRVGQIDSCATWMLVDMMVRLEQIECTLALVYGDRHAGALRRIEEQVSDEPRLRPRNFVDMDAALEWAEDELLRRFGGAGSAAAAVPPRQQPFFEGLEASSLDQLEPLLERRTWERGAHILHEGDEASELVLLVAGQASVSVPLANGRDRRVATLGPGAVFGEMALFDEAPRSANVRADSVCETLTLSVDAFSRLESDHPAIALQLLRNLLRASARTLRRMNEELVARIE